MSTRFMCGETYGKVPIVWCDNLQLVGPQKDALGKREETKKGKCNDEVRRSYERFPMMSLLIRYAHIPFYFRFSFAFPTLPIHHYTPLLQRDCTRSRSCSHDNRTRFIGPISLI